MKLSAGLLSLAAAKTTTQTLVDNDGDEWEIKTRDSYKSWNESKEYCDSIGMEMPTPTTRAQFQMLYSLVDVGGGWVNHPGFPIGYSDVDNEGRWANAYTNKRLQFDQFWKSGEPNGGRGENYIYMTSWKLNDANEDMSYGAPHDTLKDIYTTVCWKSNMIVVPTQPPKKPDIECFAPWTKVNGECARFFTKVTGAELKQQCDKLNASPPLPANQAENDAWLAAYNEFSKSVGSDESWFWIGLQDTDTDQDFNQFDGAEPLAYTNWISGQPDDNAGDNNQHYVSMNKNSGKWADSWAAIKHTGACVKKITVDGKGNGWEIRVIRDFTSWTQSKQDCAEIGMKLPTPTNRHEMIMFHNLVVEGKMGGPYVGEEKFPIGYSDSESEGNWVNTYTGEKLPFEKFWNKGEPNNVGAGEHYMYMGVNKLNDAYDDISLYGNGIERAMTVCVCEPGQCEKKSGQGRDPVERADIIVESISNVMTDAGLEGKNIFDKVNEIVGDAKDRLVARHELLKTKGCNFPDHWDWQEYQKELADKYENDRYAQNDPCKATKQLFTALDRWSQMFTSHCKKEREDKLNYHDKQQKFLDRARDKLFKKFKC